MTPAPETLRDGRYALVRQLGEGGQAATFEAVDKRTGVLVAIKRFRVRGAKSWKEVELAEREARVLASVSHPSVPKYVEHFEQGGELFLVTEKIDGENLLSLRKRGVHFAEADVIRLLRESAAVLEYLHSRAPPVIHRDIKPSNVLRRPDGSFALIDFGAVRDRLRPEGGSTVVGTFGYMAPEQFQGRAMPASDVYALGATALCMLTGSEPEDLPHIGLAVDVATALKGTASASMIEVLRAMLEPNPDLRPTRLAPLLARFESREGRKPPDKREPDKREWDKREPGKRRLKQQQRWEEREERLARKRVKMAGRLSGGMTTVVLIGLAIAQVAVALAVQAAVPLLLTILSFFFGKGLRQAAKRTGEAGEAAQNALKRASAFVLEQGEAERIRVTELEESKGLRVEEVQESAKRTDLETAREQSAEAEAVEEAKSRAARQKLALEPKPGKRKR